MHPFVNSALAVILCYGPQGGAVAGGQESLGRHCLPLNISRTKSWYFAGGSFLLFRSSGFSLIKTKLIRTDLKFLKKEEGMVRFSGRN